LAPGLGENQVDSFGVVSGHYNQLSQRRKAPVFLRLQCNGDGAMESKPTRVEGLLHQQSEVLARRAGKTTPAMINELLRRALVANYAMEKKAKEAT
jgi:hypothetical protein